LFTYLVAVVVCLAPGGLLGFVVAPGRERWIVWAAAPILTLGLTAFGIAWLPAIGLPNSAQWVLGAEIALAALAVTGSWLVARTRSASTAAAPTVERASAKVLATGGHDEGAPAPVSASRSATTAEERVPRAEPPAQVVTWRSWLRDGAQRPRLADLIGVAVPAAVAVGFGRLLLGSLAEPPGWDAMNHALLTRNILDTGSTSASAVCTTGSPLPEVSCQFYPLGANVSWAQTAALSGGHISAVMTAWSVLIGPTALVIALYAAVRAFGGRPLVASCAAVAPVIVSPLWPALLTGRPPEAFGPGMSVAIALLVALAMRGKYPVRFGLLAGLGFAGLLVTHTYEVLFAGTLALAFVLAGRIRISLRTAPAAMGAIAFATVATVAPLTNALLGAGGQRISSRPAYVDQFGLAWHYWLADPQGYTLLGPSPYSGPSLLHVLPIRAALVLTLPCLLASPLCLVFKQLTWARPWLLTWALWTAIGLWTSVSASPVSLFLSGLWYGVPARLRTMVLPLHGVLAVAGAYAIGLCLYRLVTKVARRGRDLRLERVSAAAAAGVLAVCLIGLAATPSAHATLVNNLAERTPVGSVYPEVFEWLAQHTPAGKVVAYDRHKEFMTWSYADYGVAELFGIPPLAKENLPNYSDRWQAWLWLVNGPRAKPAGCLVRKYRIEFVVVGGKGFPRLKPDYSRARIAASPNVTLVHSDGDLKVYQVNKAGMVCANSE
jgi:hypothetical protein